MWQHEVLTDEGNYMRRILLKIAYDGTAYNGWQLAKDGESIEGKLMEAIRDLTGEEPDIGGASRTDAGVHAKANLAVFDTDSSIPGDKFSYALNTRLPDDIRVVMSKEVDRDFHPRFAHTEKTYLYRIQRGEFPDPVRTRYTWNVSYALDIEKMREAAEYLKGEHDFKSFCNVHTDVRTTVREITDIGIEERDDEIHITIKGYGFLYNMVRIITGTLVEAGRGKTEPGEMLTILKALNREKAGPTAPARGLTLMDIRILDEKSM